MPRLTHTQSAILGYLITANGNQFAGSTAHEIMEATKVSHNAVYTALRKGIPGVVECAAKTPRGATMYFASPDSLAVLKPSEPVTSGPPKAISIWDSEEWANVHPDVFGGLSLTVDDKPASIERISELTKALAELPADHKEFLYRAAIAGQAIAILALRLAKEKK